VIDLQQLRPRKLQEPLHSTTLVISTQPSPSLTAAARSDSSSLYDLSSLLARLLLARLLFPVILRVVVNDIEVLPFNPAEESYPLPEDGVALEVVGCDGGGWVKGNFGSEGAATGDRSAHSSLQRSEVSSQRVETLGETKRERVSKRKQRDENRDRGTTYVHYELFHTVQRVVEVHLGLRLPWLALLHPSGDELTRKKKRNGLSR
jgi:hypothetical protein